MEWTKDDKLALIEFKNSIENDNIRVKDKIKQILLNNRFIIHVLNNKELEENDAEPDEYYNINILPYYFVSPTQSSVNNFICFTVSSPSTNRFPLKSLRIVFTIICNKDDIKDKDTGIARHDLLASLIQNEFNYTNYFGENLVLIDDVESSLDKNYACRNLVFEQITDDNLVKTVNGVPRYVNKGVTR